MMNQPTPCAPPRPRQGRTAGSLLVAPPRLPLNGRRASSFHVGSPDRGVTGSSKTLAPRKACNPAIASGGAPLRRSVGQPGSLAGDDWLQCAIGQPLRSLGKGVKRPSSCIPAEAEVCAGSWS